MQFPFRLLLVLSLVTSLAAQDYHVSPSGNDANPGTASLPFQSISHARDIVRGETAAMTADIHVILHEGWFIQASTLAFNQLDGGTNNFHVIYEAAPGDSPVISGGQRISAWSLTDPTKNIWSAPAPGLTTRQLYVNGQEAVRARSIGNPISGATQTSTGYVIPGNSNLNGWGNISMIEFVYNSYQGGVTGGAEWSESRVGIESIAVSGGQTVITMKQPAYANATSLSWDSASFPTSVENAYELLDQPGEWYLDQSAGIMHYIPRTGENLSTAIVIAPVLETIVSGIGTSALQLTNLQFIGLTFAHGTWLRTSGMSGFPEFQANQTIDNSYVNGNVLFQRTNNLLIKNCVFTHLGGAGLELSQGVQNSTVIGCRFNETAGAGIVQGTTSDPLRSDVTLRDDSNTIQDCYFSDTVNEYHGGVPIFNGYVSNAVITHNEIVNAPYTGISIGWGWGTASYASGNHILYNHITGWMEVLADGGAWYALSAQPSSEVGWNWFQNQGIHANGGCIYPDQGSSGWNVHDNVCDDVGNWFMIWTNSINTITLQNNWTNTSTMVNLGTDITLTNNTVINGSNWPPAALAIQSSSGLEPASSNVPSLLDGTTAAPSASANLAATPTSPTSVRMNWSDVGGETGFIINRKTGSGPFVQVGQVGESVLTWIDTGLSANTSYTYCTQAFNGAGNSLYSASASATTGLGSGSAPTVIIPASGPSTPVTSTTAALNVLGGPSGSESGLTYTWSVVSSPAGGWAAFNPNGTNSAQHATATFNEAGIYSIQVSITSSGGSIISGPLSIVVVSTLSTVAVSGPSAIAVGTSGLFSASARDQFGVSLANQGPIAWSATGGTVNPNGLYSSGSTTGSYKVTATSGASSGSSVVMVTNTGSSVSTPATSSCGHGSGFSALIGLFLCLLACRFVKQKHRAGH